MKANSAKSEGLAGREGALAGMAPEGVAKGSMKGLGLAFIPVSRAGLIEAR